MEETDENIFIPLKPVYEEFVCPICMEMIKECTITACGHNYCKSCIEESINRKHICPICSAPTVKTQLFPNKHFDRLGSIIIEEKNKASKLYFESLISGKSSKVNSSSKADEPVQFTPIEQLFHNHMKSSLASYDQYYNKLKSKNDVARKEIEEEYTNKMVAESKKSSNKNLRLSQDNTIKELKRECERKLAENEAVFSRSTELLLKSYEEFLKKITPAPQFLPVTVDVFIVEKKIKIQNVVIKPVDTVKDLKKVIETNLEKSGDPISNWKKENIFVIMTNAADKQGIIIQNDDVPIIQHSIDPGASIHILGKILCKSDAPKECFRSIFDANKNMTIDYLSCKECGYNWICKSCAETCHKGHIISTYLTQHKPSWGCCYCAKKGKCKLFSEKK